VLVIHRLLPKHTQVMS